MLFFPIIDFWIANEPPSLQPLTPLLDQEELVEEPLSKEDSFQILPYQLEGSVENFDSVARASFLAKTLPKKWCGTFEQFNKESKFNLILNFLDVSIAGHIVNLEGEMLIEGKRLSLQGNLNAKSNQLELLVASGDSIGSLEPGGRFMGLQGFSLLGWKPPRLNSQGGKLKIYKECEGKSSEPPDIISIW